MKQDVVKPKTNGKELTLKEKLLSDKKDEKPTVVEEEKKEEIKSEPKEEEKIVTKIDFLRDFKNFDPDNAKGKESNNPQRKIKISLTSKKE